MASGEKAFESLNLILTTIEARIADQSKLLIKGAGAKINKNGTIQDKHTAEKIDKIVESFIKSMADESGIPTKYPQV